MKTKHQNRQAGIGVLALGIIGGIGALVIGIGLGLGVYKIHSLLHTDGNPLPLPVKTNVAALNPFDCEGNRIIP